MSASVIARCPHAARSGAVPDQHARSALVVAVFGALLASRAGFVPGLRVSLLIAAAVVLAAAAVTTRALLAGREKQMK